MASGTGREHSCILTQIKGKIYCLELPAEKAIILYQTPRFAAGGMLAAGIGSRIYSSVIFGLKLKREKKVIQCIFVIFSVWGNYMTKI